MRDFVGKLSATLALLGLSFHVSAFELSGTASNLTADGGVDSEFTPIMFDHAPITIDSTTKNLSCQGAFQLEELANVGSISTPKDVLAVFSGSDDVVFTLHFRTDNQDWQVVSTDKRIPCYNSQSLALRATFYRQNNQALPSNGLNRTIYKTFALKDQINTRQIVNLNATLNFAKPPKTYSCRVVSAQQNITLDKISVQQLSEQQRVQNGSSADFVLDCDSAKATVIAMVYDNFDVNNFGADKTILSVKSNSAKGVGVQLYKDGQILKLGQKLSKYQATDDGTQWKIDGDAQRRIQLKAGYIKTGEITSGKIQAQAGLVFFYP